MRFHLVYHGQLPSTGNNPKPADVMRIRRELSPQLEYLWQTHPALKVLRREGARHRPGTILYVDPDLSPREMATEYPESFEYLVDPIIVGPKQYLPLVRQSLSLGCEVSILFLRQDEAGKLVTQGGDLDGRMKCLLDALRMPSVAEQSRALPAEDLLHCLMEGDELVTRLDIESDRLLFPATIHQHEVHLTIEVSINVLQVGPHNMALL